MVLALAGDVAVTAAEQARATAARLLAAREPASEGAVGPSALSLIDRPGRPKNEWERELAAALADIRKALGAAGTIDRQPLFVDAAELFKREYPATQWQVDGLVSRGGLVLLGAEPKSGKTWVATEIAVAVATGTKVCGEFQAERGVVAYFFAEDLAIQIRNRVRALMSGRGMSPEAICNLHVCPRGQFVDITKDEDLAWIVASCRRIGNVDLVVLDPLRDIHTAEEDKSDGMTVVMKRLRVLGELLGATVAVPHHAGKPTGDSVKRRPGQRMRGSSAIYGSTDSGIYFGMRGGDGVSCFVLDVDVEIKGGRSAGHFGLKLELEDDDDGAALSATWSVTQAEVTPASKATDEGDDKAVLERVRGLSIKGQSMAWNQLRQSCGIPHARATKARDRLLHNDKLVLLDFIDPATGRIEKGRLTLPPQPAPSAAKSESQLGMTGLGEDRHHLHHHEFNEARKGPRG